MQWIFILQVVYQWDVFSTESNLYHRACCNKYLYYRSCTNEKSCLQSPTFTTEHVTINIYITGHVPMRCLVYRVQPLPQSMLQQIFILQVMYQWDVLYTEFNLYHRACYNKYLYYRSCSNETSCLQSPTFTTEHVTINIYITGHVPMRRLVYRVQPLPQSMLQ